MQSRSITAAPSLMELRRRLERWRRGRCKNAGRLPHQLWQLAAEVARIEGVAKTASALQLDRNRLEQWVAREAAPPPATEVGPAFVELPPLAWGHQAQCMLELEDASGRKLRISLSGDAIGQVRELSERLWRSTP